MCKDIIKKAKDYVKLKHLTPSQEQRYGGKPYTFHTNMVADNAVRFLYYIEASNKDNVVVAAHGHDLLEDTDTTQKDLVRIFNKTVADIIFRVTDERGFDKKEMLFKTLPKIWQSHLATYVKLCDRMANGRNSKNGNSEKSKRMYKRYKEQYPVFRYGLKTDTFGDMWKELDEIFEWLDN